MDNVVRNIALMLIVGVLGNIASHLGDIAKTLNNHKPACVVQPAPKAKGMV